MQSVCKMCHYYMKLNIMSTSFPLYDRILTYQISADRSYCDIVCQQYM